MIKIRADRLKLKEVNNRDVNELKCWFFERINKIDKLLTRVTMKKKKRCKSPISGMKHRISTDPADLKMIIIEYYEQL